ncbi:MAG: hypothetical protein GX335_02525 [Firmicutes bacterium]|nr:hypothetical protein [Bacillota bacterium]
MQVRFFDADSFQGRVSPRHREKNLPLVIIAGQICCRGELSLELIQEKLQNMLGGGGG